MQKRIDFPVRVELMVAQDVGEFELVEIFIFMDEHNLRQALLLLDHPLQVIILRFLPEGVKMVTAQLAKSAESGIGHFSNSFRQRLNRHKSPRKSCHPEKMDPRGQTP